MSTLNLDQHNRTLWPVANIDDSNRMRQDYGNLDDLAASIREHGLIHPIVINVHGRLIAGGRRLRAMRDILRWTEVPVTYYEFADELTLRILEREENVRRKQTTWQEDCLAIADVHQHHSLNAALKSEKWTMQATGELLGYSKAATVYALQMADLIKSGDREILGCVRMNDALNLLVKRRAEESNKLVAKLTLPKIDVAAARADVLAQNLDGSADDIFTSLEPGESGVGTGVLAPSDDGEMPGGGTASTAPKTVIPLSQMLLHGDAIAILEQFPAASVDHVITDWPYGIDMDNLNQSNPHGGMKDVDLVSAEHDVLENEALHQVIIPLIHRVLRPGGFFITWTDYMQWQRNYDLAIKAGFRVQRWPLVWYKTSRCMNQMALVNWTKNTEPAIACRKDNANLNSPQASSVWPGGNDAEVQALGHPFAKPFGLWTWLYSAVAHRGQVVLDPFAGRGSSTIAALQFGLSPVAIEKNDAHYSGLVVNVSEWYKRTLGGNVEFV